VQCNVEGNQSPWRKPRLSKSPSLSHEFGSIRNRTQDLRTTLSTATFCLAEKDVFLCFMFFRINRKISEVMVNGQVPFSQPEGCGFKVLTDSILFNAEETGISAGLQF
jgi:hypothetical protein